MSLVAFFFFFFGSVNVNYSAVFIAFSGVKKLKLFCLKSLQAFVVL